MGGDFTERGAVIGSAICSDSEIIALALVDPDRDIGCLPWSALVPGFGTRHPVPVERCRECIGDALPEYFGQITRVVDEVSVD